MKSLKESLEQEILCGKQLFEKLKIRKSVKNTISIPIVKYKDNVIFKNAEWKKLTLPDEEYVVYRDCYHRNKAHLAHIDDFLFQMMQFQNDFEDFDMKADILFASDDEKEIAEWYIKDYLGLKLPKDDGDTADWVNAQPPRADNNIYDNLWFLHDVYLGYDHIDDSMKLDKSNMEDLAYSFNEFLGCEIDDLL